MEETKLDLLKDLGLGESFSNKTLDLIVKTEHKYVRDLRMNVKSVMESQNLSLKETHLLSIAILSNNGNQILLESMKVKAQSLGVSDLEIADAIACASLLSANNVFYRFRHFINKESYNTLPARLRMKYNDEPSIGKRIF